NNVKLPLIMKAYTRFTQDQLIKSSKFTLATAKKLVEDFRKINNKSFELPLGAPDFEVKKDHQLLREKDGVIKVVLLGFIDKEKTPIKLLQEILQFKNVELYLIGPIKDDILNYLTPSEKVFVLGTQTGDILLDSLLKMDVAIAPYYM